ncbi:MAG: ABC transporter permease [Clostridia bacterium]|nr:ABC transporter permease [Clostridia bacterium]
MRILWILIKKEWTEALRSKRFLSLVVLFVFFGLLSPLTARFMNDIVKALVTDPSVAEITKYMPEPTYLDAYRQIFKNFSQMGVLIILLVFMGMVSTEKSKGTAVLVLTKGVPRGTFLVAKFISALVVFLISYGVSIGIFLYYTNLLFGKVLDSSTLPSFFFFGLFVIFMIALTLFCSTLAKSTGQSALMVVLTYFLLSILSAVPQLKAYLPNTLSAFNYPLSDAANALSQYQGPILSSLVLTAFFMVGAIMIFRKQEI